MYAYNNLEVACAYHGALEAGRYPGAEPQAIAEHGDQLRDWIAGVPREGEIRGLLRAAGGPASRVEPGIEDELFMRSMREAHTVRPNRHTLSIGVERSEVSLGRLAGKVPGHSEYILRLDLKRFRRGESSMSEGSEQQYAQRRILFQGDSITDGNRGRDTDPNHILGHGYAFWIAAELGLKLAAKQPGFINRGISGNRVSDLESRWQEDAIELVPDTISILVGVNDILMSIAEPGGFDPTEYEQGYRRLLERTHSDLPEAQLVLCEPFILPGGHTDSDWQAWRAAADACSEAVRRLAQQFGATFVPLQDAFDEACQAAPASYWIWDGVHPTTAGHGLLAKRWLEVVQASKAAIL